MNKPTCIDLFAGAGGLSEGFAMAGFDVLAANDLDPHAAETLKSVHPQAAFLNGRIEEISATDFLSSTGLQRGELDCLVGGPPCQAFSVYNHQRGMHDERSGLFREYIRIVQGLLPRCVVMENVTGITSVAEGRAVEEIYNRLSEIGYRVDRRILKAEQFGIPQERRRIFFVGTRIGERFDWPTPTHGTAGNLLGLQPYVSIWDAIGDLPALGLLEGDEEQQYTQKPLTDYQLLLRTGSSKIYNHVAPFLSDINQKRLKHIPQGGSWRDIPVSLLPAGMKRARRCDHTKRYGRPKPESLSGTILTKCDLHWGAYIHPFQDRTFTVREAARLQSFPDRIRFSGPRVEQFRQVGNAVPPLLAKALAIKVAAHLEANIEQQMELANAS